MTQKMMAGAVLVLAAFVAYLGYATYDKRTQRQAIAALVAECSAQLQEVLVKQPSAEAVLKLESGIEALQGARKSRQALFAEAAPAKF